MWKNLFQRRRVTQSLVDNEELRSLITGCWSFKTVLIICSDSGGGGLSRSDLSQKLYHTRTHAHTHTATMYACYRRIWNIALVIVLCVIVLFYRRHLSLPLSCRFFLFLLLTTVMTPLLLLFLCTYKVFEVFYLQRARTQCSALDIEYSNVSTCADNGVPS